MSEPLIIVHVHVHVKPDAVEAFRVASIANASASVREPGVARFDVVQSVEDETRFVLVEVYRNAGAPAPRAALGDGFPKPAGGRLKQVLV